MHSKIGPKYASCCDFAKTGSSLLAYLGTFQGSGSDLVKNVTVRKRTEKPPQSKRDTARERKKEQHPAG